MAKQFGTKPGHSRYDQIYKRNKKFRDFIERIKKLDPRYKNFVWEEIQGNPGNIKRALYERFQTELKFPKKPGYTVMTKELARLLGLDEAYFDKVSKGSTRKADKFIFDNFPKVQSVEGGYLHNFYKVDPKKVDKFKTLFGGEATTLAKDTEKRVYEIDKKFRKTIVTNKKLPSVFEVMQKTSADTPSKAASAMAAYSKVLRGEIFRNDFTIKPNETAGKRVITQLGDSAKRNEYRTAFYRLALANVDKEFNKQGTLSDFKKDFNKSLRKVMNLPKGASVPYNVNEVISLSAGEARDIRPFSVFVDATLSDINQKNLATYQGVLSEKVSQVQDLISKNKISEAEKVAESLKDTQKQVGKTLLDQGYTKAQIKQLNLPDIKIGTDVLETYKAEDLARYKKSGLDIEKFAKDKGYYIDAKKAKPYFDVSEKSFRNVILQAAKTNEGGVCQIFRAEGGRIGYAAGSNCARQMEFAFDSDPVRTTEQINKIKTVPEKVKAAGMGFLNFVKRGGKFGALAAVGAGAAAIVKPFMNDDPTTYLSNEDQQKNMLISMVTDPVVDEPKADSAILDYQLPAIGAGAVAGTAATAPSTIKAARSRRFGKTPSGYTKTGLKTLGRGLTALGTPAALLATEPLFIGGQIAQGDSLGEIATNPINYLGAAFADPATRFATKGLGPTASKIMRLGISPGALRIASRAFGLPGLALSLGISGYEMYDDYKKKRGMFSEE